MANEQELEEIKQTLQKLEGQVAQLRADSKRQRSGWSRFAIGFLIVFFVMFISIGVVQFVSNFK
ncbi:hypothetical protein [Paenibacillus sp. PL91]|uniref:hypothetical protein n=1 Tax=Paenibacillus sp. PL91 TaxID=2729538 RepID=UPI00145E8CB2|nr:hypothetical protein [Paenibacillus sp. PL91]MBC9199671.1 hypothetical protein [Paenibacillus sp. PL91]